jgi:hypothetical protein
LDFYKVNPKVLVGVPTLTGAPMSWEWSNSFYSLGFPLGTAMTRKFVYGKRVDEARNEIVMDSLHLGCDWTMFVGDDNILPWNAFSLLSRHKKDMVTGVYWTKSYPRQPYLWNNLLDGPFDDWKYGDFFKVDWAGCDCLLVNNDVFRAIEPPWFSCDWVWKKGNVKINLPTEDIYFYTKARAAGFELWCDSVCQCGHQCRDTKNVYGLDSTMKQHQDYAALIPENSDEKYIADIGCGHWTPAWEGAKVKRFDIDPETKPDVLCDVRAIPEADETFDAVYSSHVLEHFFYWEAPELIKEWVRILKIGGTLQVSVPNMEYAAREIIKACDDNGDLSYVHGMIWGNRPAAGAPVGEVKLNSYKDNQMHKTGYTRKGLQGLFVNMGLTEIVVDACGTDGEASLTASGKKVKSWPEELLSIWDDIEKIEEISDNGNAEVEKAKKKKAKVDG